LDGHQPQVARELDPDMELQTGKKSNNDEPFENSHRKIGIARQEKKILDRSIRADQSAK
jgi:hypothetical protein